MSKKNRTSRCLGIASVAAALAVGSVAAFAFEPEGFPDETEPFDMNGNTITDHWRFPTSPTPDLWDEDEDGCIDSWDYNSTGQFVPFLALNTVFASYANSGCFSSGYNGHCQCEYNKYWDWTCYNNNSGNECYDLNFVDWNDNVAQAVICKDGKKKKRWGN